MQSCGGEKYQSVDYGLYRFTGLIYKYTKNYSLFFFLLSLIVNILPSVEDMWLDRLTKWLVSLFHELRSN